MATDEIEAYETAKLRALAALSAFKSTSVDSTYAEDELSLVLEDLLLATVARDTLVLEESAELIRVKAELSSLRNPTTSTGYVSPRETWPDDSEANAAIAEAENFSEAIWEIAEKYHVPVTNNLPRWQDGQFLREMGDFIGDVKSAAERFMKTD